MQFIFDNYKVQMFVSLSTNEKREGFFWEDEDDFGVGGDGFGQAAALLRAAPNWRFAINAYFEFLGHLLFIDNS